MSYVDSVFNAFYGPNSPLRVVIRKDLESMHKYRYLRNPEPKTYGPKKRKRK